MRHRAILLAVIAATTLLAGADMYKYKLVDRRTDPDAERRKFRNLLIIAITDDREVRRNFENRFVSHLRGREVGAVTSYSIVPDLAAEEDEEAIVERIAELKIDGALTVRLVAVGKNHPDETEWGKAWRAAAEGDGDLRALIDESLPVTQDKSKRFGVEIALWETGEWDRIWAGRTRSFTRKELRKGAADFVQYVMHILEADDLL